MSNPFGVSVDLFKKRIAGNTAVISGFFDQISKQFLKFIFILSVNGI